MSTVDHTDQQRLVHRWQHATEEVIRYLPGFISAAIYRSLDGTKVINYTQWESPEAFDAMRRNPDAAAHLRELAQVGTPAPLVGGGLGSSRQKIGRTRSGRVSHRAGVPDQRDPPRLSGHGHRSPHPRTKRTRLQGA